MNSQHFKRAIFSLLAMALVADNTFADHKADHPPPGFSGLTEGGPLWVLIDSDGTPKQVGVVDHAEANSVWIRLTLEGEEALLQVEPNKIRINTQLFFTTSDCTGTAYALRTGYTPIVVAPEEGKPNTVRVYEIIGGFSIIFLNSWLEDGGFCSAFGTDSLVAPVGAPGDDLHVVYPPPYTLVPTP